MTAKPAGNLDWLEGNLDPNSTEPPDLLKENGWQPGESPYSDHFNYMFRNLDQWAKVLEERDQFEWVVGDGANADFATLTACLASGDVYGGDRILVTNTITLGAALTISKGVQITFAQNSQIRGVLANAAIKIDITTGNVKIRGGTFQAFNTTISIFNFAVGATNCEIDGISVSNPLVFDDSAVPAGLKPSVRGVRYNDLA